MANIGIDARLIQYRIGGISSYTLALLRALADIPSPHSITAFTGRKNKAYPTLPVNTQKLWTPPHHTIERLSLSLELMPHRLDIFHATDFIPPQFGAKNHVATIHDLTFLHFPKHKDRAGQRYYIDQIEYAVKHATHLLAVSEATKSDLMNLLSVPEKSITVQPHGVEKRFHPVPDHQKQIRRKDLKLPDNYILFVGTLEPRKNIPCLLDAYQRLPQTLSKHCTLLLVGQSGWLFEDTQQQINQLQSNGVDIQVRHDINDDDLPAVYALAEALVLPSLYEGFGMPIIEAMACGTPVIASDNSSLPEVAGNAGLLFESDNALDLADKLEFALTNQQWRETAIKNGIAHASTFTWERSAKTALSVYSSISA